MSEPLQKLKKVVLFWVSMDYESIESILQNVINDYDADVKPDELHKTLLELRSMGLIESYAYSTHDQEYIPQVKVSNKPGKEIWWYITTRGKKIINE